MSDDMLEIVLDSTTRILTDSVTPEVRAAALNGQWPAALWQQLTETGLTLALVSEEDGGVGLPGADALAALRRASEFAVPVPLGDTMLANALCARFGLGVVDGPVSLANVGETPALTLQKADGGWQVEGTLTGLSWPRAIVAVLALGLEEATGKIHMLCIPADALNLTSEAPGITGLPTGTASVSTLIPEENVAVSDDFGPEDLMLAGAVLRVVGMAGTMQKILEMTLSWMGERTQFGRPLSKFQVIQHELAKVGAATAAAKACADIVAEAYPADLDLPLVAAAKARAGEAAGLVANISHQMHGAIGFTEEFALHHLTRQLFAWRDDFGTETYWTRRLTGAAQADGDLWSFITRTGQ